MKDYINEDSYQDNKKEFVEKVLEISKEKQLSISASIEIVKAIFIIDRLDGIYDMLGYLQTIEDKINNLSERNMYE